MGWQCLKPNFRLVPVLEVSVAKRPASFLLDLPPLPTLLPLAGVRSGDFTLCDEGLSGIVGVRHHGPKLAVEKEDFLDDSSLET